MTIDFTNFTGGSFAISLNGTPPDDPTGLGTIDGVFQSVDEAGGSVVHASEPFVFTPIPEPTGIGTMGAAHYHLRHDQKTPSKQKNR